LTHAEAVGSSRRLKERQVKPSCMVNTSKRSGKVVLVSQKNFERLTKVGWYGDTFDSIVGRVLDVYDVEMAKRKAAAPGTESLEPHQ
jgi:hypothetical protein